MNRKLFQSRGITAADPYVVHTLSMMFQIIYNTAHYLYYINTAIDVLVYAFSRYV